MRNVDAPLAFTCGADWNEMKRIDDRARLCGACDKIVHDLSAMDEAEARRVLGDRGRGRCVRYLFDPATGDIAFRGATLVPTSRLTRGAGWKKALTLSAPLLLQACMGALPADSGVNHAIDAGQDARTSEEPSVVATPDGGDGGDANGDGGDTDGATDAAPDAGPADADAQSD